MARPLSQAVKGVDIRLDWRAYFKRFCEVHGGGLYPVNYKGRLLFPDGWMYSATSYRGPEWPPEPGNVRKYKTIYWEDRRNVVRRVLRRQQMTLENLVQLQHAHSAPLMERARVINEDTQETTTQSIPVDLEVIRTRIKMLQADLQECDDKLAEIGSEEEPTNE